MDIPTYYANSDDQTRVSVNALRGAIDVYNIDKYDERIQRIIDPVPLRAPLLGQIQPRRAMRNSSTQIISLYGSDAYRLGLKKICNILRRQGGYGAVRSAGHSW